MPTVPVYDAPQVQRQGLRGGENQSRADVDALGGTQARNLAAAGQGLAQLSDTMQRVQDRRDLDEAFRVETAVLSEYQTFEQDLRKTRRGVNAKDVTADVDGWWAKSEEKFGQDMSPRVKQLVSKSLSRARAQSLDAMGRFQFAEEDRAQAESFNAVQGQEIQRAITAGDPAALETAKGKLQAAVNVFGVTRGWTSEQMTAEQQKWTNTLHTQALSSMVDANPEAAKKYYEAHRDEIDSQNHARIEKIIDKGVTEQKATTNVASMASLPFEQQMEKASKIADPQERKLTIAGIKDLVAEKEIASREREKAASDQVWQMVASGVPMGKLPKATLERMDGKERVQVNQYYEAERKRRLTESEGRSVKTDYKVYDDLMNMPKDQFLGVRISALQDKLSRGDMEKLIDRQAKLRDPKESGEVASTEQQMGTYVTTLRLKDEKKGAFQSAAYNEFNEFKKANKREPNFDERQKILDRLSMQNDGGWFGSTKSYFEVPEKERAKFVEDTVPKADRDEIIAELKKRGKPVTNATILDLYRAANK